MEKFNNYFFILLLLLISNSSYSQTDQVLLLENAPTAIDIGPSQVLKTGMYAQGKLKPIDSGQFGKIVKEAIGALENSMRGTCAKQMETSISVTAEGKWILGVSITGALNLLIMNPKMAKGCGR